MGDEINWVHKYDAARILGCTPTPVREVSAVIDIENVNSSKAILVWRWKEAPYQLKQLSDHGGDEDWLALIPPSFEGDWIGWLEVGSSFGCCDVSKHKLPNGYVVMIGAHA